MILQKTTITLDQWFAAGLTKHLYENDKRRGHLETTGRAAKGKPVQIVWDSLRDKRKKAIIEAIGNPEENTIKDYTDKIEHDNEAYSYYTQYIYPNGMPLIPEKINTYYATACVLNAMIKEYNTIIGLRKRGTIGTADVMPKLANKLKYIDKEKWSFKLPASHSRLKEKMRTYQQKVDEWSRNYKCLVERYVGNQNRRKVDDNIEQLLISIYCMENIPFGSWVCEYYNEFMAGQRDIVNRETGEILNPDHFLGAGNKVVEVAESTARYYFYKNKNLVDSLRNNRIDHITGSSPYNNRHRPNYAGSKISMDDRTLPRKTLSGEWINCYMAVDVMSTAWIGYIHCVGSVGIEHIWECFRSMYNTLKEVGAKWPAEVEVENHLMRNIEKELKLMFAEVTFTTPGVSRGKRAEHNIRAKKYGDEKRYQTGIGRWYGKGSYKTKSENKDEEYKQERLAREQLIADDIESINRHNNSPHPDQKKYKGKTRWQVFVENQNPKLPTPQPHLLMRFMGVPTKTSITNNAFLQVQYNTYYIESLQLLDRLQPYNNNVVARWIADNDGNIGEVYLYQSDKYIGKAYLEERYNEAKVERTEKDYAIKLKQDKRQKEYFSHLKKEKAKKYIKVEVLPGKFEMPEDLEPEIIDVSPDVANNDNDDDWECDIDPEYWAEKARNDR